MNTAIINISDRAFSAVGFTVVADMWVCCVCGLWSHRWHFSFCFYTFYIASTLAGCSVCRRVVCAVCENGMFYHLPSLTPDRHNKHTYTFVIVCRYIGTSCQCMRRDDDIRISIRTTDNDTTFIKKELEILKPNAMAFKRKMVKFERWFFDKFASNESNYAIAGATAEYKQHAVVHIKGIDTTANVPEQFDCTVSWCGVSRACRPHLTHAFVCA